MSEDFVRIESVKYSFGSLMASPSLPLNHFSCDNEEQFEMGPELCGEDTGGHNGSAGGERDPAGGSTAAEKLAAQKKAEEYSAIAAGSVGALAAVYAALAVQAAEGRRADGGGGLEGGDCTEK